MITSSYWKDLAYFLRMIEVTYRATMSAQLTDLYAILSTLFGQIYSVIISTVLKKANSGDKPEGFIIHYLKLRYTNEMEKAMLSAHGVCYEDYKRKLNVRMEVEKRRELDYLISKRLSADIDGRIHF